MDAVVAALDAVPVVLAGDLEAGGVEEAEDGERRGVELGGDAEPVGLGQAAGGGSPSG